MEAHRALLDSPSSTRRRITSDRVGLSVFEPMIMLGHLLGSSFSDCLIPTQQAASGLRVDLAYQAHLSAKNRASPVALAEVGRLTGCLGLWSQAFPFSFSQAASLILGYHKSEAKESAWLPASSTNSQTGREMFSAEANSGTEPLSRLCLHGV